MTPVHEAAPTPDEAESARVLHSELTYACLQAREAQHHLETPYPRAALESSRIAAEAICKAIRFRETGSAFSGKKSDLMLDAMTRWLEARPEVPSQMIYWLDVIRTGGNQAAHAQPEGSQEFLVEGIRPILSLLECALNWCFRRYYRREYRLGELPPAAAPSPVTPAPAPGSGAGGVRAASVQEGSVTACQLVQLKALGGLRGWVQVTVFSGDSRRVLSGGTDRVVRSWKTTAPYPTEGQQSYGTSIQALAANPVRDEWVVAGSGSLVKLWRGADGLPGVLTGQSADILVLAYHPGGETLAGGARDGTVLVWNTARGGQPACVSSVAGAIRSLAYSPKGNLLAAGDAHGTVHRWECSADGTPRTALPAFRADAQCLSTLAFLENTRSLATGGSEASPRVWTLDGRPGDIKLAAHEKEIVGVAVNRPDRLYAFASLDGGIRVYRFDHHPVGTLHTNEQVLSLAFSPDGRLLATGNSTGQTRLWRVDLRRG